MNLFRIYFLLLLYICYFCNYSFGYGFGDCSALNYCSGHGTCDGKTTSCICYAGWGAESDKTDYRAPDCSARTCPSRPAWAALPNADGSSHTSTSIVECSGKGLCDRVSGSCKCFPGFTGSACQRSECLNSCSGHGACTSMRRYARTPEAQPLTSTESIEYGISGILSTDTAWDSDMIFVCNCDSSWPVGLAAGQTQVPEYFGADCSLRHCPSGDDPLTTPFMDPITSFEATFNSGNQLINVQSINYGAIFVGQKITGTGISAGTYISSEVTGSGGVGTYLMNFNATATVSGSSLVTVSGLANHIETDCTGIRAPGGTSLAVGAPGNLCHVECSNRGQCNYKTGECTCYEGFYGASCSLFKSEY